MLTLNMYLVDMTVTHISLSHYNLICETWLT